jgi:hypothetical protein
MEQLSNAEIAELILLARSSMDTQFQYWISVTFAVVVAGFVAGDRLSQGLRYVVATLYVLASLVLVQRFYFTALSTAELGNRLVESGDPIFPPVGLSIQIPRVAVFALGTIAALYFLLLKRQRRK